MRLPESVTAASLAAYAVVLCAPACAPDIGDEVPEAADGQVAAQGDFDKASGWNRCYYAVTKAENRGLVRSWLAPGDSTLGENRLQGLERALQRRQDYAKVTDSNARVCEKGDLFMYVYKHSASVRKAFAKLEGAPRDWLPWKIVGPNRKLSLAVPLFVVGAAYVYNLYTMHKMLSLPSGTSAPKRCVQVPQDPLLRAKQARQIVSWTYQLDALANTYPACKLSKVSENQLTSPERRCLQTGVTWIAQSSELWEMVENLMVDNLPGKVPAFVKDYIMKGMAKAGAFSGYGVNSEVLLLVLESTANLIANSCQPDLWRDATHVAITNLIAHVRGEVALFAPAG